MNVSTKNKRISRIHAICLAFIFTVSQFACTLTSVGFRQDQSHFTFPNAEVVPIGPAQGTASKTSTRLIHFDAALERQAIEDALRKSGGDVLINYRTIIKVRQNFTLLFVNFYTTTVRVQGTSCIMKISD